MKTLGLALLVFVGSTVLPAQPSIQLKAEIPFAFEMADQKLPAGEYQFIRKTGEASVGVSTPEKFILKVLNGVGLSNDAAKDGVYAKLVFNKYGDRYFLSQVWSPNHSEQLFKSKSERMMVTSTLITANRREEVVILARAF